MDLPDLILGQADRDELGQLLVVTDDAQRPVGRVHQPDCGLHDPPQRGLQVKAGADGDDGLEQAAHLVPGPEHRLQPALQFRKQLVKPKLRKEVQAAVDIIVHRSLLLAGMQR